MRGSDARAPATVSLEDKLCRTAEWAQSEVGGGRGHSALLHSKRDSVVSQGRPRTRSSSRPCKIDSSLSGIVAPSRTLTT